MADGASPNERLLAAAKADNEEMILEVLEEGGFDINFKDGLGNTALHYAAITPSPDVIEHILECDDCDVDPQNRLDRSTPLHSALRLQDKALRKHIVSSLLDAGADYNVKDKYGVRPIDIVPDDDGIRQLFRKAQTEASMSHHDIAVDDDDDGEPGSGSDDD